MPMSAVLVGLVPVSKLNGFGLSECGDAVVELANHSLESAAGFGTDDAFVVDVLLAALLPLMLSLPLLELPDNTLFELVVTVACPSAIAIGLGDESGDDVSDDIYVINVVDQSLVLSY